MIERRSIVATRMGLSSRLSSLYFALVIERGFNKAIAWDSNPSHQVLLEYKGCTYATSGVSFYMLIALLRLHLHSITNILAFMYAVPSSIIYSHTCNVTALTNISTLISPHVWPYPITNANSQVRTRACGLMLSTHASLCHVPNDFISRHHLHHRVQAHNLYTSTPPCAKWL